MLAMRMTLLPSGLISPRSCAVVGVKLSTSVALYSRIVGQTVHLRVTDRVAVRFGEQVWVAVEMKKASVKVHPGDGNACWSGKVKLISLRRYRRTRDMGRIRYPVDPEVGPV